MSVLVDTCVWSLALRRRSRDLATQEAEAVEALQGLIGDGRVRMLGVIRQELLSGIKDMPSFKRLRDHLADFPDEAVGTADHEAAASDYNACMARGIAGTTIDLLLCAVAKRRGWTLFSIDPDFVRYRDVLGFALLPMDSAR